MTNSSNTSKEVKFYFDTEFHEYHKSVNASKVAKLFFPKFARQIVRPIPTIDLISIGVVSENGEPFYRVSSDFNVLDAWNNDFLRENVLVKIYEENKDAAQGWNV